ncbi:MAG TPA: nucleotide disphospho-sugar-binding domain-containing protein [Steroidobacteraceae bacterium]|jgi:hypothetical protein|nr:nucleotide disphospho-sugar-binding domain-containing protein [Steroidobacteraceae bacterium]
MLPIIRALRARGVEPLVAVPDPERALRLFGAEAPRMIRAIPLPLANGTLRAFNSHADIFLQGGFANVTTLSVAVDGWRALYRDERIECVVLDYAPVAQLAAWLMGLRMVTRSSAFAAPPVPLPAFLPVTPRIAGLIEASERELLHCVNHLVTRDGRPALESLAPWLLSSKRFFSGTAQLSVFDVAPEGGYLGPLGALPGTETAEWPDSGRARVLCYLRWSPRTPALIEALDRADRELVCAIPQAPGQWAQGLPRERVRVFTAPVDLQRLIRTANVIVSHASAGVACEALIAGKPQLFIPLDREKMLIAQRLTQLKVALMLPPGAPAAQASLSMQRLLDDSGFTLAAKKISHELRPEEWAMSLDRLVGTCADSN